MRADIRNRVLPAAVYDALQAKANEVGGVGAVELYDQQSGMPRCIVGIAHAALPLDPEDVARGKALLAKMGLTRPEASPEFVYTVLPRAFADALGLPAVGECAARPVYEMNDDAVGALAHSSARWDRIAWDRYAACVGWTRGPEEVTP